ncbi:DUF4837 family protein [Flavobacteriales bacterium]|nr:DUF4837 family protein [Flavobacteriales bacterium]
MKNLLFCLFVLLGSCSRELKTLPNSTGSLSEIIFVVEDVLWEQKIKLLVNKTLSSPIEGLNQNEANYKVVQINQSEFKSILKTHKNIVIVSSNANEGSQQNKWAKDQLVFQLNWQNDTISTLEYLKKVKSIFDVNEIKKLKQIILKTTNKKAQENIKKNFSIDGAIPKEYSIVQDTSTLFWATYNPPKAEEIKHLIIYSFRPSSINLQNEVLSKTDSIFSKYLLGAPKGSYVKIEPQYPPFFKNDTYRGLWKLENGFMGGPFLIKTYFIEEKIVVAVGVIFAPQSQKRNYLKELEAIL